MKKIEYKIAKLVNKQGGDVYYVGGYVRDKLLNIKSKDIDIEIHNISYDQLSNILKEVGKPLSYGASFGIFSLREHNIDIAMPRTETNTGKGHRDFEIYVDPYIGTKKASKRRDFTINAIMQNVLTGQLIDHYKGTKDLENRIIRHIDDKTFVEDPLRVFRAAQFASRFEFKIARKTISLCRTVDVKALSKERVELELKKALLKANKPSIFFDSLSKMNQLNYWFKEVEQLKTIKQDKIHHPEGNVYIHSMMVLDEAAKYRNKVDNPYAFMLLALCHDFGKITTTFKKGSRIHAYNHENEGIDIIKPFLKRFTNDKKIIKYVLNMSKLHMQPNNCARNNSSIKATNNMFDKAISPKDLIYFAMCDHKCENKNDNRYKYLIERYKIYEGIISNNTITGNDLIAAGLTPNKNFSKLLSYSHKLQLSGLNKEECLKQTLIYAKKLA